MAEWDALKQYVQAPSSEDDIVERCWNTASEAIEKELADNGVDRTCLPVNLLEQAIVEVGSELYHRRNAPFGVTTFAGADGAIGMRVSADSLVRARVLLAPWYKAGFA